MSDILDYSLQYPSPKISFFPLCPIWLIRVPHSELTWVNCQSSKIFYQVTRYEVVAKEYLKGQCQSRSIQFIVYPCSLLLIWFIPQSKNFLHKVFAVTQNYVSKCKVKVKSQSFYTSAFYFKGDYSKIVTDIQFHIHLCKNIYARIVYIYRHRDIFNYCRSITC